MKLNHAPVLLVEHEPLLRESMGGWLEQKVGRALCAENGEGSLAILAANRIDLLLSDAHAGHGRHRLGQKTSRINSPLHVVLVTGFSDLTPMLIPR